MVKTYKVQVNKANGQPFVNLSKKEGWKEGDELNFSLKWGSVHNKKMLDKYYSENKTRLDELKQKLQEHHKKSFESEQYLFIKNELPKAFDFGKMEEGYEEPITFANNDFGVELYGDIDGGTIGDVVYSLDRFVKLIKENKYDLKNTYVKELKELAFIRFFKDCYERFLDDYTREQTSIFKEFNFEPDKNNLDDSDSIFTDEKVFLKMFENNINGLSILDYNQEESIDL